MTIFSHYPLQKAMYAMLSADSTLTAMITGIYDRPAQDCAFPYVILGENTVKDWSSATSAGAEHLFSFHAWSREGGKKQAISIMSRIHALLHDANPSVEGQRVVMLRFVKSNVSLENDGWTYHGIMQFRALLEESI